MRKQLSLLLCAVLLCGMAGCAGKPETVSSVPTWLPTTTPTVASEATEATGTTEATEPTQALPPVSEPAPTEPGDQVFTLSFAGDCTFGDNYTSEGWGSGFCKTVGDRYDYPFANVKHIFESDDCTFVNLEGALTSYTASASELGEVATHEFRFRGPQAYAKILTAGGVEFASCANNHSMDYGQQGWKDTLEALDNEEVAYATFRQPKVITTESGLKIGVAAIAFNVSAQEVRQYVSQLREEGAELIIFSAHWGEEAVYAPSGTQVSLAHLFIDSGADIVFGHHSHTLMPIEHYKDGVIFYSLGNFSFGGNSSPSDMDTAVIQQEVTRHADGTLSLGRLLIYPCRVSSVTNYNNYQPTPLATDSDAYKRVLKKISGFY